MKEELFQSQEARAYYKIMGMIARGELKHGEKITLQSLSDLIDTSIIPIRDALRQLQYDRLVERTGRSYFRVLSLSRKRIEELSILREAIEVQTARMCAERVKDEELAALRQTADKLDRTIQAGLYTESVELERQFHLKIAQIASCSILIEELERLYLVYATFPYEPLEHIYSHNDLIIAIESRDAEAAEHKMRLHVQARKERILKSVVQIIRTSDSEL